MTAKEKTMTEANEILADNIMPLREALEFIKLASEDYEKYGTTKAGALDVIYEKACTALANPAHNCNVETVNVRKSRKIAQMICRLINDLRKEKTISVDIAKDAFNMIDDLAKELLITPPRNCDVGTPASQARRYHNFTDRYNPCSYKGYVRCAEDCPVHKKLMQEGHGELLCQLEWEQMPYEEGDGKQ